MNFETYHAKASQTKIHIIYVDRMVTMKNEFIYFRRLFFSLL